MIRSSVPRRVAFVLLVLMAVAATAEGFARLGGSLLFPARRALEALPGEAVPGEPNMVVDAVTGWRPRTGPQQSFGIPGGTTVNSRGLRGPEFAIPKPRGERRVLLVGDSSVFGVMVRDAEIFPRLLQDHLQAIDPDIRVLDGAAPGWSSYQARRALEERLLVYEPDLLVIATLWSDTQVGELADAVRFRPLVPFLVESNAYLLVREWVNQLRYGDATEEVRVALLPPDRAAGGPPGGPGEASDHRAQAGPRRAPPVWTTLRVPLPDYKVNLARMSELVRAQGGDVAFLVLPCNRDPHTGKVGDFRDEYRAAMRQTASALGSPLADTPMAFIDEAPSVFYDEVHPTPRGHAIIADVLTTALRPWAEAGR